MTTLFKISKLKNTLSALALSFGFLLAGYGLGSPVAANAEAQTTPAVQTHSPAVAEADAEGSRTIEATPVSRRSHGLRRQLGMPFISFSPLLPRRGV